MRKLAFLFFLLSFVHLLNAQTFKTAVVSVYGNKQLNAPFLANVVNGVKVLTDDSAFYQGPVITYAKDVLFEKFQKDKLFDFVDEKLILDNSAYKDFGNKFLKQKQELGIACASGYIYFPLSRNNLVVLSSVFNDVDFDYFIVLEVNTSLKKWTDLTGGLYYTAKGVADITLKLFDREGRLILKSHSHEVSTDKVRFWLDGTVVKQTKIHAVCRNAVDIAMEKIKQDLMKRNS